MTGHVWPLGYDAVYTSPREYREGMTLQDGTWLPASWHYGCDWAAPTGTPVLAAHDGNLQNLVEPGGAGNYVNVVAHDGAHRSMYMHLDGFARDPGPVAAGDVIGYVGSTGASTGPHLHFQVHEPATGWPSVEPVAFLITSDVATVPGQVYAWCKAHGLSDAGAAGWMGNMRGECGNPYTGVEMDPAIVEGFTYYLEDLEPGIREGVGMIQFSYGRRVAMLNYAEGRNRPWQQPEVQLDYMLVEIDAEQRYRDMWERLKEHTDPVAACRDIAIGDGVPGFTGYIRPGHYGDRDTYAADYFARILAGEFGTPTPPLPPPYVPVHQDVYPSGDDMATTLIIDIPDAPEGIPPVWEYTGVSLQPFPDASLSGDYERQSRSYGAFLPLFARYLTVYRLGLDGVPLETQLRNHAREALEKFNASA